VSRDLDRRAFLRRAGGLALAAGALPGWELVATAAPASVDPRVRQLARQVKGPVITPASNAYNAARTVYNLRYAGVRPMAIVQAASVQDVQRTVNWARRNRIPIVARSGGHSYAGYSTTTGVVVDLSNFSAVRVLGTGVAQVGAGARLIDLYSTLANRGLTVPGGSCPTVGVGGLAQGGGLGLAARRFGTTSDNILGVQVVTADGRVLTANARQNPNLYWACRGGGGGNFGIVTSFQFRTHPVTSASYFFASFPWSAAGVVVPRWLRWAPEGPDALYSICSLSTGSSGPTLNVFGQFFGTTAALRAELRGLTRAAAPTSLSVGTQDYLDLMMRWAGCLGESLAACRAFKPEAFAAKSDYVAEPLSSRGVSTITSWIGRRQAQSSIGSGALLMDSYGGAINRVPPGATAFVHRDNLCSLQYLAYWGGAGGLAPSLAWIRGFYAAMRPFVSGFAYQNYIDRDLTTWQHAYYGANFPRLVEVKSQYDPDELFKFPQGIPANA